MIKCKYYNMCRLRVADLCAVETFCYRSMYHCQCCFVCSGNYNGQKPYKKSDVCTQCPSGHGWCDNGLCRRGEISDCDV